MTSLGPQGGAGAASNNDNADLGLGPLQLASLSMSYQIIETETSRMRTLLQIHELEDNDTTAGFATRSPLVDLGLLRRLFEGNWSPLGLLSAE